MMTLTAQQIAIALVLARIATCLVAALIALGVTVVVRLLIETTQRARKGGQRRD